MVRRPVGEVKLVEDERYWERGKLIVSANGRYLQHADGTPFFWLGDTAWLLLKRTTREQALTYLRDRKNKGFNVIQMMLVHDLVTANAYGRLPFRELDLNQPDAKRSDAYTSYWSYADEVIAMAEREGLYVALVPVWGSVVQHYRPDAGTAGRYGQWLGNRYKDRPNVIWLNGGDIHGSDHTDVWLQLGRALRQAAPEQLMTFHPYGRIGPKRRPSRRSTASRPMRIFRMACIFWTRPDGRRAIYGVLPIGRCSQAHSDIPTDIIPLCSFIRRSAALAHMAVREAGPMRLMMKARNRWRI
jgi:hypothetical protein